MLHKHGYPAVQFVPLAYVGDRQPLPHEERLAASGVLNPTVDWEELGELEQLGVRIESHGISHVRSPTSRSTKRRARSRSPS